MLSNNENTTDVRWIVIPLTLLLALYLNVIPYPEWARFAHTDWVTLVLFYWCLAIPRWVGVGYGWVMGLLLDVLHFTLYGQHAIGKALIAWFVVSTYPQLRRYPVWQQCIVIVMLSSVDIGIVTWISSITADVAIRAEYWLSAITTGLLWPLVYILLRMLRRRSGLTRW